MTTDVMLDIETLGKGNNAVILSLGAVKFSPWGHGIDDSFYVAVNPESCQALGLALDASTVMWWMADERTEARSKMVKEDRVDLVEALYGFNDWFGDDKPVWGNGATFDNVIMSSAYKACSIERPWKFWNDKCYRTVKGMAPSVKLVREGTYHNALDDAVSQAKHLQKLYFALRIPKQS
jgi:hypothetical protein